MTCEPLMDGLVRRMCALAFGLGCALTAGPSFAAAAPVALAVDAETTVNGVQVACTGVGGTRSESRWTTYGVRVEFSNALNEYLVGGAIVVRDRTGRELLEVSCDAPWILLRLPKGAYRVEGRLLDSPAKPRSAPFSPPAAGQIRLVLQFPDA
jgi:hypothetical protein